MIDAPNQALSSTAARSPRRSKSKSSRGTAAGTSGRALQVDRIFSARDIPPFDQIEWEKRTAEISDEGGKVIFKQEDVEVPKSWSLLATKVVVSKYFYGEQNTPER